MSNTSFFLFAIVWLNKKNGNPHLFRRGLFPPRQCSPCGFETSSYCDRLRRKEGRTEVSAEQKRSEEAEKMVVKSSVTYIRPGVTSVT